MQRILLHCDMNNYFASIEEKGNPALRRVPFAVCGDPEMRHNVVMARNMLAKQAGVVSGISFHQAEQICPGLACVRADLKKYLAETKLARAIYLKYTDTIIPYGLDEAWIDLTDTGASMQDAKQIADLIRLEIKYAQGLSASVGVSDNYIFAKLGSDYQKPDATTVITRDNYKQIVWPLPASDLLFVGQKRSRVLLSAGIRTIGDIAHADPKRLGRMLGKAGYDIWQFANGDDRSFNPETAEIGSAGCTITPPADLQNSEEVSAILYLQVSTICARLKKHELKAGCFSIFMKDNQFGEFSRQCSIKQPTDSVGLIYNKVFDLFTKNYDWKNPLRSVGVRVSRLQSRADEQMVLFNEDCAIDIDIERRVQALTAKFGNLTEEITAMTKDW